MIFCKQLISEGQLAAELDVLPCNGPETWELLQKIHALAEPLGLTLLPEIHAAYDEKIYQTLAEKGYATYDFFLPGLVIDAIENRRGTYLAAWAKEIVEKKISTVNMLGCHDGIPLLDSISEPEQNEKLWGAWRWYQETGNGYTADWGAHMFNTSSSSVMGETRMSR